MRQVSIFAFQIFITIPAKPKFFSLCKDHHLQQNEDDLKDNIQLCNTQKWKKPLAHMHYDSP